MSVVGADPRLNVPSMTSIVASVPIGFDWLVAVFNPSGEEAGSVATRRGVSTDCRHASLESRRTPGNGVCTSSHATAKLVATP
jgi:hypothetical protein